MLLSHGSGGSRERVAAHVRMLARHGYGVLAFDNPGNGESQGHSDGLGYNAQPAVDAAPPVADPTARRGPATNRRLRLVAGRRGAARGRSSTPQLRAVVADGPTRPQDAHRVSDPALPERTFGALWLQAVRGISGAREAPSLNGIMPRIAPRPVLLIAGGVGAPDEIPANRVYREEGGPTTQLWEIPDAGHTAGLRTHPAEYERRTTAFLDQALGLQRDSVTSSQPTALVSAVS